MKLISCFGPINELVNCPVMSMQPTLKCMFPTVMLTDAKSIAFFRCVCSLPLTVEHMNADADTAGDRRPSDAERYADV